MAGPSGSASATAAATGGFKPVRCTRPGHCHHECDMHDHSHTPDASSIKPPLSPQIAA